MDLIESMKKAEANMKTRLVRNPCRLVVAGLDGGANFVQGAGMMGRSSNSQNRIYVVEEDGTIRTEAKDPSSVKNPELIIYNAMRSVGGKVYVVTNGDHTDTIIDHLTNNSRESPAVNFFNALNLRHCEPDPPYFTPRIAALQDHDDDDQVHMSILKADPLAKEHWVAIADDSRAQGNELQGNAFNEYVGKRCNLDHRKFPTTRQFFQMGVQRGLGYCLPTYQPKDPQHLLSFEGEPFLVPIRTTVKETMDMFWDALEPEWRAGFAGKRIEYGNETIPEPKSRFKEVE